MSSLSLWERLRHHQYSSLPKITLEDIAQEVCYNLRNLLGTRRGNTLLSSCFGLTDYAGDCYDVNAVLVQIENEIKETITRFEPRLNITGVKGQVADAVEGKLRFTISGSILHEGQARLVYYHTVMTKTGRLTVSR